MKEFLDTYGDVIMACVGTIIVITMMIIAFKSGGFLGDMLLSNIGRAV